MSALTTANRHPSALELVHRPSSELADALEALDGRTYAGRTPDDAPHRLPARPPSPQARAEAAQLLAAAASVPCSPATVDMVRSWLVVLNSAVRNPQASEDLRLRAVAVAVACEDLPMWVFSEETQRKAMRTFQFWPSTADVHKLLLEHARPTLDRLAALRRVVNAPASAEAPPEIELTPAERAALAAKMRSSLDILLAEREQTSPAQPKVRPRYLTPEQLRLAREQQGIVGPQT